MAPNKKKTLTAKRRKESKTEAKLRSQSKREILGVFLAALGLFLGASLYSDAVGIVGSMVKDCFFGIFGIVGYAMPALFLLAGIIVIIKSEQETRPSLLILSIAGVLSLLSICHIIMRPLTSDSITLLTYYGDAYTYGTSSLRGGGILGSLLAYPAQLLVGEIGSYIFFTAAVIAILLAITKLSLHDTAKKVGSSIKNKAESVSGRVQGEKKNGLYTETLLEQDNRQKTIMQRQKKKLLRRKARAAETIVDTVQNSNSGPELMPTSGRIKRRNVTGNSIDADESFPSPDFGVFEKSSQYKPVAPAPLLFGEEPPRSESNLVFESEDQPLNAKEEPALDLSIKKEKKPSNSVSKKKADEKTEEKAAEHNYERPPLTLLKRPDKARQGSAESPNERARLLEQTLASFNIQAKVTNVSVGPVITRFEVQPAQGVRVNRITTLSNDIALSLAAPRVRIEAPIPGKAVIGIEVPNKSTAMVLLREIVETDEFMESRSPITFALGKDIAGKVICADLDRMPHLLIAGSTGSGKSVCINDIIISMSYKATPEEVRMILIDPKVVELKMFSTLPHLLLPVVTDPKKAAGALKWAVMEMEQRYQKMSQLNARDLSRYNMLLQNEEDRLPKIVIVIDELADLMMVAAKDVEESVCRIAQLGRACGIHLIVATQRPSTDIITGLIKANIPSRIAFMVSSAVDSRVILDCNGAEKLLGKGDMLFHANGANKPTRIQCAFISDEEVENIMNFFGANPGEPMLDELSVIAMNSPDSGIAQGNGKQEDDLLSEAVKIVLDSGQASISMIQRRLRVGYARAARLIDIMEQKKIVSGFDGSKPRKLLIDHADYERMFMGNTDDAAMEDEIE